MFDLTNPIFHNEDAAREHLEGIRWPNGPICPHCGNADAGKIHVLRGKSHRPGLFQCNECRGHFTVTVDSVMERSKIPLTKWVAAFHLMASSKKGMSAHQLHRMLGVTYKTAWFLAHRVREAMSTTDAGPIGGEGKSVEADETYYGDKDDQTRHATYHQHEPKSVLYAQKGSAVKRAIVALVERGGEVRMFKVERANKAAIREVLVRHADRKSFLYTDESNLYTELGGEYASHDTVKHSADEYVRYEGDKVIHTNTIENVFSVFKRGMSGVYQHCGESHLHRYLSEFEFRYNTRSKLGFSDVQRAAKAVKGAEGKRLMYRQPRQA